MNFILDFVKQGGYIGYILVALNFIGYYLEGDFANCL